MRQEAFEARRLRGAIDLDRRVPARELRLVEVDHDQQRLGGKELESTQPLQILAFQIERAQRLRLFERGLADLDDVALALQIRRPHFLQILVETFEASFGDAEVRKDQLVFHRLRISRRVDRS